MSLSSTQYISPEVNAVINHRKDILNDTQYHLSTKDYLSQLADRLKSGFINDEPGAEVVLSNWHPILSQIPKDGWISNLPDNDFKLTVAREHGFPSWDEVIDKSPDPEFEQFVDAALHGDLESVKKQVKQKPDLINQRSHFGHEATILHYLGVNGTETQRQIIPGNVISILDFLITNGSDPTAQANFYGNPSLPIELLESSAHPKAAGIYHEMHQLLAPSGYPDH